MQYNFLLLKLYQLCLFAGVETATEKCVCVCVCVGGGGGGGGGHFSGGAVQLFLSTAL